MERKVYTTEQKQAAINSLKSHGASELKRVAEEVGTSVQNIRNWAKVIKHPTLGKLVTKARIKETTAGISIGDFLTMPEEKLQAFMNARTLLADKVSRRDELQRQLDELNDEIQQDIKRIEKEFKQ